MINIDKAKRYCREDIVLIENYQSAIEDKNTMWHCHHRKEATKTKQQLLDENDYWSVPAKDLIFLLPSQHRQLHFNECAGAKECRAKIGAKSKGNKYGAGNFKGKHHTDEAKKKISEAASQRTGMKSARIRKDIWDKKDEILKLLASGLSDRKIALIYDCSRTVIANIRSANR